MGWGWGSDIGQPVIHFAQLWRPEGQNSHQLHQPDWARVCPYLRPRHVWGRTGGHLGQGSQSLQILQGQTFAFGLPRRRVRLINCSKPQATLRVGQSPRRTFAAIYLGSDIAQLFVNGFVAAIDVV